MAASAAFMAVSSPCNAAKSRPDRSARSKARFEETLDFRRRGAALKLEIRGVNDDQAVACDGQRRRLARPEDYLADPLRQDTRTGCIIAEVHNINSINASNFTGSGYRC